MSVVEIAVTLPVTLHARPASLVVNGARKFAAKIQLGRDGRFVDAASLFGILSLGATEGATLVIRADGPDEAAAAEEMAKLLSGLSA
jgi:phosphocarrier protein HPr